MCGGRVLEFFWQNDKPPFEVLSAPFVTKDQTALHPTQSGTPPPRQHVPLEKLLSQVPVPAGAVFEELNENSVYKSMIVCVCRSVRPHGVTHESAGQCVFNLHLLCATLVLLIVSRLT